MADTIDNIPLPKGVWVNIYANNAVVAAGWGVGTRLIVSNESGETCHLVAAANAPVAGNSTYGRKTMQPWLAYINDTTDNGAWVKCISGDGLINVEEDV